MNRRIAISVLFSMCAYREFVRRGETFYVNKTLVTSDFSRFDVQNCTIKRGPFLPKDAPMIHLDNEDAVLLDCALLN